MEIMVKLSHLRDFSSQNYYQNLLKIIIPYYSNLRADTETFFYEI